jgi:XapX domain-containing protein
MTDLRTYLIALGAGLLAGMLYGLLNVRSPAPPIVGLIGLLGILVGEQVPALAKRLLAGDASAQAFKESRQHRLLRPLPRGEKPPPPERPA